MAAVVALVATMVRYATALPTPCATRTGGALLLHLLLAAARTTPPHLLSWELPCFVALQALASHVGRPSDTVAMDQRNIYRKSMLGVI